jgi:hypothetical protein
MFSVGYIVDFGSTEKALGECGWEFLYSAESGSLDPLRSGVILALVLFPRVLSQQPQSSSVVGNPVGIGRPRPPTEVSPYPFPERLICGCPARPARVFKTKSCKSVVVWDQLHACRSAAMIKNFEEVKKQLAELADILNKFKSEQVQVKIVELIYKGAGVPQEADAGNGGSDDSNLQKKRARRARTKKVGAVSEQANGKKRVVSRGSGPMPTLEQFIQEGFFAQKRAIGAIVDHCKTKARNFKNNEISGPLGRLVRSGKLTRTKNSDGQWEYIKK